MQISAKRGVLMMGVGLAALALVLAACSSKPSSASTGSGGYGGSTSTGSSGGSSSGTSATASLTTHQASSVGTVVANGKGYTLYSVKGDKNKVVCTGSCASVWPPFIVTGSMPSASGLSGKLGEIKDPNGKMQLTYDGYPLYAYSGDSAPGQANGQAYKAPFGVWYAMTPSGLASSSSSGSGSSGSSGGGGY